MTASISIAVLAPITYLCIGIVVSAIRTPVKLDGQMRVQIEQLMREVETLRKPVPRLEQSRRDLISSALRHATANHDAVLRHILVNHEVDPAKLLQEARHGVAEDEVRQTLRLASDLLNLAESGRRHISIKPEFADALEFYLDSKPAASSAATSL